MGSVQKIDLMIAGAQKCGTTSLLNYIAQHPQIRTHRQAEMSFFVNDHEYEAGFEPAWIKYFGGVRFDDEKLAAKHVMLMYSASGIDRLRAHNSDCVLVVLLRNPVDRAYSAYWYARRRGRETLDTFEKGLDAEELRLKESWHKWRNTAYTAGGHYVDFIRIVLESFPPEQLHVIEIEQLKRDPGRTCESLYAAIGVDPGFRPSLEIAHNRAARARSAKVAAAVQSFASSDGWLKKSLRRVVPPAASNKIRRAVNRLNDVDFTPPPMATRTRAKLLEHFKPYNDALGAHLGRDFSRWNQ